MESVKTVDSNNGFGYNVIKSDERQSSAGGLWEILCDVNFGSEFRPNLSILIVLHRNEWYVSAW